MSSSVPWGLEIEQDKGNTGYDVCHKLLDHRLFHYTVKVKDQVNNFKKTDEDSYVFSTFPQEF